MTRQLPVPVTGTRALEPVSPLQLYLKEIAKHPLLSPEEEFETARQLYDEGDIAAAHRLVTSNLRLVVKIANDFKQARVNTLDLIQEGNTGLMQAVKKFNPYKGVKLSSYAAWWIRAYILKYIMDNKSLVKIGTTAAQRKLYYNLRKETDRLLAEYDRVDTRLLAENLNVKEKEIIEMQMRLGSPDVSLDAPVGNEEGGTTRGMMLESDDTSAEELVSGLEIRRAFGEHLRDFAATLKERDLEIFNTRMLAEQPLTLQEIGNKYGISRERARQLEARILKNLRNFVKSKGIIDV